MRPLGATSYHGAVMAETLKVRQGFSLSNEHSHNSMSYFTVSSHRGLGSFCLSSERLTEQVSGVGRSCENVRAFLMGQLYAL